MFNGVVSLSRDLKLPDRGNEFNGGLHYDRCFRAAVQYSALKRRGGTTRWWQEPAALLDVHVPLSYDGASHPLWLQEFETPLESRGPGQSVAKQIGHLGQNRVLHDLSISLSMLIYQVIQYSIPHNLWYWSSKSKLWIATSILLCVISWWMQVWLTFTVGAWPCRFNKDKNHP